jgi:predicted ester cyclase
MKRYLYAVPLVLLLCFSFACQDKAAMAELEKFKAQEKLESENEAVVRQVFEAIDAQDYDRFRELLVPGIIVHYSGPQEDLTYDSGVQFIKTFYNAFPDYTHSVEDIFSKGDRVAIRMLQKATQKGELEGIPFTGNKVQYYQITIMRVKDGKVQDWWIVEDNLGFYQQLGMELKPKAPAKWEPGISAFTRMKVRPIGIISTKGDQNA